MTYKEEKRKTIEKYSTLDIFLQKIKNRERKKRNVCFIYNKMEIQIHTFKHKDVGCSENNAHCYFPWKLQQMQTILEN